ncbi:hypothetical protein ZIOFF_047116 [Zingiber officinale]|uniref:Protein kinase domain-containing protein n=1 Tax=Zingiber officinale TaxID=94328 RepID=A0A8J5KJM1_ZINOF|nr:hypothetical protein ZIOFF_047116 [Zingiber officinale]
MGRDLSYNNLTGTIPSVLAELTSLKVLDLTSNQLKGPIPSALLERSQNGFLTLRMPMFTSHARTEGHPSLCDSGTSCGVISRSKKKLATSVIAVLCLVPVVILLVVMAIIWRVKKSQGLWRNTIMSPQNQVFSNQGKGQYHNSLQLENRRFTYMELKNITNNFKKILGRTARTRTLSWGQRLQIVREAAQGLKYLDKGCKPPLIHRDVKTANILLSENLEAKIADFGVSSFPKTFSELTCAGIMMPSNSAKKVMCTASGVVLLELVTGQPPLMRTVENENTNVAQMVRQKLVRGDIEDSSMPGCEGTVT